jgi:hypothetical protein
LLMPACSATWRWENKVSASTLCFLAFDIALFPAIDALISEGEAHNGNRRRP